MTDQPAASSEATAEYAQRLLDETREELNRADTKASIVFGAVGIAAGAVLGGMIGGDWDPTAMHPCAQVFWWAGAAGVAVSIVLVASAVYPRIVHSEGRERLTFFGHAAAYGSVGELAAALPAAAARANGRPFDQLWHVSRIVTRKYRLVRWGLRVLAGSVFLLVVPVVVDGLFG